MHVQRSITFPPIRLARLDEYVRHVAQRPLPARELREAGLDVGRGRGDITRFMARLGVVSVSSSVVSLTPLGAELVSLRSALGLPAYHALFVQRLPQYRLLLEVAAALGTASPSRLHEELNLKVKAMSPTAWVNNVAFRSLLYLALDVGALEKSGPAYRHVGDPLRLSLASYLERYGVKIGQRYYLGRDFLLEASCATPERPQDLYLVDLECTANRILSRFAM